jgi:hypothetical protein
MLLSSAVAEAEVVAEFVGQQMEAESAVQAAVLEQALHLGKCFLLMFRNQLLLVLAVLAGLVLQQVLLIQEPMEAAEAMEGLLFLLI